MIYDDVFPVALAEHVRAWLALSTHLKQAPWGSSLPGTWHLLRWCQQASWVRRPSSAASSPSCVDQQGLRRRVVPVWRFFWPWVPKASTPDWLKQMVPMLPPLSRCEKPRQGPSNTSLVEQESNPCARPSAYSWARYPFANRYHTLADSFASSSPPVLPCCPLLPDGPD